MIFYLWGSLNQYFKRKGAKGGGEIPKRVIFSDFGNVTVFPKEQMCPLAGNRKC